MPSSGSGYDIDWGQIFGSAIGAGASYYGDKEASRNIGKERPLTANETWLSDRQKKDIEYSPYRDYHGSLMHQAMQQMYGPNGMMFGSQGGPDASPLFATDGFKNFKMPAFNLNFDGLPTPWATGRPGTAAPAGNAGPPGGGGGGFAGGGGGGGGRVPTLAPPPDHMQPEIPTDPNAMPGGFADWNPSRIFDDMGGNITPPPGVDRGDLGGLLGRASDLVTQSGGLQWLLRAGAIGLGTALGIPPDQAAWLYDRLKKRFGTQDLPPASGSFPSPPFQPGTLPGGGK